MTARLSSDAELRVLCHDEHFLVLDKPAGIATTSPDGRDCLAQRARALDPRAERSHPSSRLDADVSGVVVFARTSAAIEALLEARRAGRYARRYLALTGAPADDCALSSSDSARWTWAIAIDPRDPRKRRALEPGQHGEREQEAETRARVLDRSSLALALVLEPITGRTHQLRVHAARAGLPLLGDVAYGGARRLVAADGSVLACPRVALHCAVVLVPAPDGALRVFRSEWPADLAALGAAVGLVAPSGDALEAEVRAALR